MSVAGGTLHSLALKSNGTVASWGNTASPPVGLANVVAIAVGFAHSLALARLPSQIVTGPTNLTAISGSNAVLSVTASGTAPLTFQWRKDGKALLNATNATLMLNNVQPSDVGVYSVLVSNMVSTATSGGATLTVILGPSITTQPQNQTATNGNAVSLSVAASGTAPLTYQWRTNGVDLTGATGSMLTVTNISPAKAGNYTVRVSNAAGSVLSDIAVVTVLVSPAINAQPQPVAAIIGSEAVFTVSASGTSPLAFQWQKNGQDILNATNATLRLMNVQPSDAGAYSVLLNNIVGGVASSGVTLTVIRLSQTITFGSLPARFIGDASFPLGATASSGLPVNYSSSNPGVATVSGNAVTIVGVGSTVITATQSGDATYQPANPVPQTLTVNPIGASVTTPPQSQTVNSGATVSFTVSASGTPPLSYQWLTNGVDLAGATNQTLTLTNVTTANAGSYAVRVSNAGGSVVSGSATLTVFNLTVDGLATGSSIIRPGPALVAVSSHFPGGFTFYTLDGSAPTTSSTLYSGPFTLTNSATVRVLALSSDFLQSVPGPAVAVQIVPFYSVSLTTPGGGSASVSPAQASYPSNSVVTLTATPEPGWTFLRWEGDATSTNNPLALTLNAAKTVRAIFGTPVARSAVGGGVVEFEPERAAYDFGSRLRAKALPNAGNKFVVWSGALSGITNGLDLTLTQPGQTVSALFTALAGNEVSLVALPAGPGSVTLNPHKNAYTLGEVVQLTATADGTNQFLGWTGDLSGTTSPVDVTMNASKRMTAFFGLPLPPVILTQPQGATVLAGTNLTLTVEASGPPLGYQWFHRGQSLLGATNTTLSLSNIARAQGGAYYVVITNLNGATNSSNAVVRVLAPTLFLPPEFSAGTPLRLRFSENGVGGVLTSNDAGNFEVHVSTNAAGTNWLRLNVPLTVTNGQLVFEDGESVSLPRRFYRVIER